MKFLYRPTTNTKQFSKNTRALSQIKWIVIHYTGNPNKGADALCHYRYLNNATRLGSAHYYVDDKNIVQTIGDSKIAWAVGDNQGYGKALNGCTNTNSISIEMCINSDGDFTKTYKNTVELTKNLMKKFNIPIERVCRHYDVTRKDCPHNFRANNWQKWWQFKEDIKKPIEWIIDLEKDSEFGENIMQKTQPTQKEQTQQEFIEQNGLKIIKTTQDKIYIQQLGGKTLRQVGAYGINGTFFDTPRPELTKSTWQIAVNNGKPIGENAHTNSYKGIKRATIINTEKGTTIQRINSIQEIKEKINWAIGGIGLYPSYDPKIEQVPQDILRNTNHTAIEFNKDTIYLIVSEPMNMITFKEKILKTIPVQGIVALDGGGSTQMLWKNNKGIHTTRKLNNMIGVKK